MVYDLQLLTYAYPHLHLSITCGRGTYIRAIARDIGQHLACGGYLSALRRTASGGFAVEHATSTDHLTPANILSLLHPITPPRKYPTPPRAKRSPEPPQKNPASGNVLLPPPPPDR
jgi:tRNA U55 pseudouridine synthase TruB